MTNTPTDTPTPTHTPTVTNTPTDTPTPTHTPTVTNTPTDTPTATNTPTDTPTNTPTHTSTPSPTPTPLGGSGQLVFEIDPLNRLEESQILRDLALINTDGTGYQQIVDDPRDDRHAAWSPDGSQIAFVSTRSGTRAKVYVMEPNGENQTQLFELPGTSFGAYDPAWTPDGAQVAVHADAFGNFEIWSVTLEDEAPVRLTFAGDIDKEPSFSPDGTQIAYASRRDGFYDLYTLDLTDPELQPVRLTELPQNEEHPEWSPDGQQIVFQAGSGAIREAAIYVINVDGTGLTALTEGGFATTPAWSPDGEWIAFAWDRDGTDSEIYIMRRDGSDLRQLTDNDGYDYAPDWRPVAP